MIRKTLLPATTILMFFLVGLMPGPSGDLEAQQHAHDRVGFWASGAMGYGSLGLEGLPSRETGLSGHLTLGTAVSDWLLLGGGTTGWTKDMDGVRVTFQTLALMARLYPNIDSGLFVNLGFGAGRMSFSQPGLSSSDTGPGAVLGAGYDYRMDPRWSVSPYVNTVAYSVDGTRADVFQFGVGLTRH
jgi:hypothetical protein